VAKTSSLTEIYAKGFRQRDKCTCGPASLSLVHEALGLGVKEENHWLNPKFSQWLAINDFRQRGMALHELHAAAELGFGKTVEVCIKRAFPENEEVFRKDLLQFKTKKFHLILNFDQDVFLDAPEKDENNPHYSPVAQFDPKKNLLLIADVDPLIKKAYWISLETAFKGMSIPNPAFGLPRGWLTLRHR